MPTHEHWQVLLLEGPCLLAMIAGLSKEGIMPSIAADIWGENGIGLLGVTGYAIMPRAAKFNKEGVEVEEGKFVIKEVLLAASPFSGQTHTGESPWSPRFRRLCSQRLSLVVFYASAQFQR
jgi:hypothetical protein